MKGKGLAKGLAVTFGTMLRRTETQQYPDVAPELPPRTRGVIAHVAENCTVCMLCARECPDWCIYIDSHKEEVVVPGAARARQRNVLDEFAIDFSLCMYCGICVEVCPFDALHWSSEFEYAEYDIRDLLHGRERLGQWAVTVPPPQPHDPNGDLSKEETTAAKPPRVVPAKAAGAAAKAAPAKAAGAAAKAAPAKAVAAAAGERPARPVKAAPAKAAPAKAAPTEATAPPAEKPAAQAKPAEPEPAEDASVKAAPVAEAAQAKPTEADPAEPAAEDKAVADKAHQAESAKETTPDVAESEPDGRMSTMNKEPR